MPKHKTVFEDCDVLVVGGGMAGTGATFEARHWGRDLKIICVEKANIDRSGAVAQGLYAINCYMGMQWNENQPEDRGKTDIDFGPEDLSVASFKEVRKCFKKRSEKEVG